MRCDASGVFDHAAGVGEAAAICTRAACCSRQRRAIPALPFCQLTLRATKPRSSAYPASLSSIGDQVRTRRLDLGLRQRDVADQIGVATSTVTNWEKGRTTPDFRVMPKVIDFLGYEPVDAARVPTRGAAIVQFRRSRGISQKELAWVLGVDPGTVGKWETGRGWPAGMLLSRIQRTRVWRGGLDVALSMTLTPRMTSGTVVVEVERRRATDLTGPASLGPPPPGRVAACR